MKIQNQSSSTGRASRAFTLIEMIGVLAIIAILAALLVPKIFESINSARVNNAVVSYNTVKTAVMDHYGKFGAIDKTTNGTPLTTPTSSYDATLLTEGLLDKLFQVKIGTNSYVHVGPPATYLLDGTNNAVTGASLVVDVVIEGVAAADAKDVNDRLDGDKAPFNVVVGSDDTAGRVRYTNSTKTLAIYVTHR